MNTKVTTGTEATATKAAKIISQGLEELTRDRPILVLEPKFSELFNLDPSGKLARNARAVWRKNAGKKYRGPESVSQEYNEANAMRVEAMFSPLDEGDNLERFVRTAMGLEPDTPKADQIGWDGLSTSYYRLSRRKRAKRSKTKRVIPWIEDLIRGSGNTWYKPWGETKPEELAKSAIQQFRSDLSSFDDEQRLYNALAQIGNAKTWPAAYRAICRFVDRDMAVSSEVFARAVNRAQDRFAVPVQYDDPTRRGRDSDKREEWKKLCNAPIDRASLNKFAVKQRVKRVTKYINETKDSIAEHEAKVEIGRIAVTQIREAAAKKGMSVADFFNLNRSAEASSRRLISAIRAPLKITKNESRYSRSLRIEMIAKKEGRGKDQSIFSSSKLYNGAAYNILALLDIVEPPKKDNSWIRENRTEALERNIRRQKQYLKILELCLWDVKSGAARCESPGYVPSDLLNVFGPNDVQPWPNAPGSDFSIYTSRTFDRYGKERQGFFTPRGSIRGRTSEVIMYGVAAPKINARAIDESIRKAQLALKGSGGGKYFSPQSVPRSKQVAVSGWAKSPVGANDYGWGTPQWARTAQYGRVPVLASDKLQLTSTINALAGVGPVVAYAGVISLNNFGWLGSRRGQSNPHGNYAGGPLTVTVRWHRREYADPRRLIEVSAKLPDYLFKDVLSNVPDAKIEDKCRVIANQLEQLGKFFESSWLERPVKKPSKTEIRSFTKEINPFFLPVTTFQIVSPFGAVLSFDTKDVGSWMLMGDAQRLEAQEALYAELARQSRILQKLVSEGPAKPTKNSNKKTKAKFEIEEANDKKLRDVLDMMLAERISALRDPVYPELADIFQKMNALKLPEALSFVSLGDLNREVQLFLLTDWRDFLDLKLSGSLIDKAKLDAEKRNSDYRESQTEKAREMKKTTIAKKPKPKKVEIATLEPGQTVSPMSASELRALGDELTKAVQLKGKDGQFVSNPKLWAKTNREIDGYYYVQFELDGTITDVVPIDPASAGKRFNLAAMRRKLGDGMSQTLAVISRGLTKNKQIGDCPPQSREGFVACTTRYNADGTVKNVDVHRPAKGADEVVSSLGYLDLLAMFFHPTTEHRRPARLMLLPKKLNSELVLVTARPGQMVTANDVWPLPWLGPKGDRPRVRKQFSKSKLSAVLRYINENSDAGLSDEQQKQLISQPWNDAAFVLGSDPNAAKVLPIWRLSSTGSMKSTAIESQWFQPPVAGKKLEKLKNQTGRGLAPGNILIAAKSLIPPQYLEDGKKNKNYEAWEPLDKFFHASSSSSGRLPGVPDVQQLVAASFVALISYWSFPNDQWIKGWDIQKGAGTVLGSWFRYLPPSVAKAIGKLDQSENEILAAAEQNASTATLLNNNAKMQTAAMEMLAQKIRDGFSHNASKFSKQFVSPTRAWEKKTAKALRKSTRRVKTQLVDQGRTPKAAKNAARKPKAKPMAREQLPFTKREKQRLDTAAEQADRALKEADSRASLTASVSDSGAVRVEIKAAAPELVQVMGSSREVAIFDTIEDDAIPALRQVRDNAKTVARDMRKSAKKKAPKKAAKKKATKKVAKKKAPKKLAKKAPAKKTATAKAKPSVTKMAARGVRTTPFTNLIPLARLHSAPSNKSRQKAVAQGLGMDKLERVYWSWKGRDHVYLTELGEAVAERFKRTKAGAVAVGLNSRCAQEMFQIGSDFRQGGRNPSLGGSGVRKKLIGCGLLESGSRDKPNKLTPLGRAVANGMARGMRKDEAKAFRQYLKDAGRFVVMLTDGKGPQRVGAYGTFRKAAKKATRTVADRVQAGTRVAYPPGWEGASATRYAEVKRSGEGSAIAKVVARKVSKVDPLEKDGTSKMVKGKGARVRIEVGTDDVLRAGSRAAGRRRTARRKASQKKRPGVSKAAIRKAIGEIVG
jgi:hypothetical protein